MGATLSKSLEEGKRMKKILELSVDLQNREQELINDMVLATLSKSLEEGKSMKKILGELSADLQIQEQEHILDMALATLAKSSGERNDLEKLLIYDPSDPLINLVVSLVRNLNNLRLYLNLIIFIILYLE